LIDKLFLERISLAGIARVVGVSERWLQGYVNRKYQEVQWRVDVQKKPKGKLTIQCDEMWSFFGNKKQKQWV
jgi:insertion element IS1 protein InsB